MANPAPGYAAADLHLPCSLVTVPAPARFRFRPPSTQAGQVTLQVTFPAEHGDVCGQFPYLGPGGVAVEQLIDLVVVGLVLSQELTGHRGGILACAREHVDR